MSFASKSPSFPSRLGCVYLLTLSTLLAAESAPSLSLAEALRRADTGSPALLAPIHATRAAEALITQAGVRPNPTLDLTLENFAGSGAFRGFDGVDTTVQISQVLERGGKREKRVGVARSGLEIAEQELVVRRAEVRAAAAAAYIAVLAANSRTDHADRSLALAREAADVITTQVQSAAASSVEAARVRAALSTTRADHTRAVSVRIKAYAALAATWGGTRDESPTLPSLPQVPDTLPDRETLFAQLSAHPLNGLQQATIGARRSAVQLARSSSAQDVTVAGGLRSLRDSGDAALVVGVSVPLPFRNQNDGAIRAAREALASAEQSARALDAELRAAFTSAWQDLQLAHTVARDLRADALPATEEALAIVRRAHAQGESSLLEVLEARRSLNALNREILDAEAAFATALVRLDALTNPTFSLTTAFLSSR